MGKLGAHTFFVGSSASFTAEEDGMLSFKINDENRGDNSGSLQVMVSVK